MNSSVLLFGQVKVYPEISLGRIYHLGGIGSNTEIGLGFELGKRIDLSVAYRAARINIFSNRRVEIDGISSFISYSLIKRKHHNLMIGTGLFYGRYYRLKSFQITDKVYIGSSWNKVKLSYDYIFINGFKIGTDIILYGDDVDTSRYLGFNIGFIY